MRGKHWPEGNTLKAGAYTLLTVLLYVALLFPLAARNSFDLSVFIGCGDIFVDRANAAPPVTVAPHSIGYDGQFFYRLAIDPFSTAPTAYGITLDEPAKRMQRIFYPLFAWAVSLRQASRLPGIMLAINLVGLGVVTALLVMLAQARNLPAWLPVAVIAWPGFLVTLTHDTAEIVATVLLLAALVCYLSDRLAAYCLFAACAALTRETTVPILLGPLMYEALDAIRCPSVSRFRAVALCGLGFVPFIVWWGMMRHIWHEPPQALQNNHDLGYPFVGAATRMFVNLTGIVIDDIRPADGLPNRIFFVGVIIGVYAFCGAVIVRMPMLLQHSRTCGLAIGWALGLALLSLLTAVGPYVEPLSLFRASTECWVVGCILLASTTPAVMALRPVMLSLGGVLFIADVITYEWCLWLFAQ